MYLELLNVLYGVVTRTCTASLQHLVPFQQG